MVEANSAETLINIYQSTSKKWTLLLKYFIVAKSAFSKRRILFTSTLDLELRKNLVKFYIWSIALYGAETWTLRAVDQKHLQSFEMWCCRRMEKISWTDHVRNEDVLLRDKEQRNILHEICKRKANWIGHILRRNCLLQRVIEGKIKGGGYKWQEDDDEDVESYWTTLRKGEDTLIWRRKLWIALCGELALEKALDLS